MVQRAKEMKIYRKKKSQNPDWVEQDRERRKEYYEKKKAKDPDFFNKKMKKWRENKIKKDPSWGAKRQKEFRKKYPDKFNYMMARFYFRRLVPEKRRELMNEVENEPRRS